MGETAQRSRRKPAPDDPYEPLFGSVGEYGDEELW